MKLLHEYVWKHIESEVRYSPFDRQALPAYVLLGLTFLIGGSLMLARGFSIDPTVRSGISATPALFLTAGLLGRRIGWNRAAGWLEASALSALFGIASTLVYCPLLGMSQPFADGALARADMTLGFRWDEAAQWLLARPRITDVAIQSYRAFLWQPPVLLALLFLTGRSRRGWTIVAAAMIGALVCAAILPILPAEGPAHHFGLHPRGALAASHAWQADDAIRRLKHGYTVIDNSILGGLVAIPSFHATAGTIYAWAAWSTRFRWVFVLVNVALICSAVVIGDHYLVDIISGVALGVVSIAITKALYCWIDGHQNWPG